MIQKLRHTAPLEYLGCPAGAWRSCCQLMAKLFNLQTRELENPEDRTTEVHDVGSFLAQFSLCMLTQMGEDYISFCIEGEESYSMVKKYREVLGAI